MSEPGKKQNVRFVKATADVSPQEERELAKIFYDKTDKKRITGPIEKAFDGDNLTAEYRCGTGAQQCLERRVRSGENGSPASLDFASRSSWSRCTAAGTAMTKRTTTPEDSASKRYGPEFSHR
ncbi:MAG: hypothetical protein U0936_22625 [Planctomycetaceae bacterium]